MKGKNKKDSEEGPATLLINRRNRNVVGEGLIKHVYR